LIVTEEAADGRNRAELTQRLCARNTGIGVDAMEFFRWTGPAALIARGEAREA
jgi:diaminopimelate epimerase